MWPPIYYDSPTGEINRRVTTLNDNLRKKGLCAIDMAPDGNYFYQALS